MIHSLPLDVSVSDACVSLHYERRHPVLVDDVVPPVPPLDAADAVVAGHAHRQVRARFVHCRENYKVKLFFG